MNSLILAAIFTRSVLSIAYALCEPANNMYAGKNVTANIVLGPSLSVTINGEVKGVSVEGKITPIDGCTVRTF